MNVSDPALAGIDIQKKDGSKVSLERKDWQVEHYRAHPYPADQDAVSSVASTLAPANADSVVEDKPGDVAKYGLTNPSLTVYRS